MQRRQGEEREFSAGSMTYSARAALQCLSTPKLPHLHFPPFQDGENGPNSGLGAQAGGVPTPTAAATRPAHSRIFPYT